MIQPMQPAQSECDRALYTAADNTPSSVLYSPKIRKSSVAVHTAHPTDAHTWGTDEHGE